jgi:hypothetical protein
MKISSNRRQIWPSRSEPQLSTRHQTAGVTLLLLLNLHPTTSRPPLPLPLRPARPPEMGGRGAGGSRETLTGRGRRKNEKGKVYVSVYISSLSVRLVLSSTGGWRSDCCRLEVGLCFWMPCLHMQWAPRAAPGFRVRSTLCDVPFSGTLMGRPLGLTAWWLGTRSAASSVMEGLGSDASPLRTSACR